MKLATQSGGFLLESAAEIGNDIPVQLLLLAQIDPTRLTETEMASVKEFMSALEENADSEFVFNETDAALIDRMMVSMDELTETSLNEGMIRQAVGGTIDALSFKDIRVWFKAKNFKKVSAEIKNYIKDIDPKYKAKGMTSFYHNVTSQSYGIGDFRTYATPERAKEAVKWFDEHKKGDTFDNLLAIYGRHISKMIFSDRVDVRTRDDLLKTHAHIDACVLKIMATVKNKEFEAYSRRICQSIYTSWFSYVRSFTRFSK